MNNSKELKRILASVPSQYKVLDHLLEFKTDHWKPEVPIGILSPVNRDVSLWYEEFEQSVFDALKQKHFYPLIRASDGEYRFLLGSQPPSKREPLLRSIKLYFKYYGSLFLLKRNGFTGQTAPGVSVGNYTADELLHGREIFTKGLGQVLEKGLLAAHLQFAPKPFQECFHYEFKRFLDSNSMALTATNYVPFYFVYLFLSRVATAGLLKGLSILFINGASVAKRDVINQQFIGYGAAETRWLSLSKDRSLFDKISLSEADQACDICMLGGGVGKFNLIQQLESFPGPVVDAGYYFEAWANPDIAKRRPFCIV